MVTEGGPFVTGPWPSILPEIDTQNPQFMVWQWYNRVLTRHPLVTQCITTGSYDILSFFILNSNGIRVLTLSCKATLFATGTQYSFAQSSVEQEMTISCSRWCDCPACCGKNRVPRLCSHFATYWFRRCSCSAVVEQLVSISRPAHTHVHAIQR